MKISSIFTSTLLLTALSLAPVSVISNDQAFALPAAQVSDKLSTVGVFAIGQTLNSSNSIEFVFTAMDDGSFYLPLFLQEKKAQEYRESLQELVGSKQKLVLMAVPLSTALSSADDFRNLEKNKGRKVMAPIIVPVVDKEAAKTILRDSGVSQDQIGSAISVPVFYTNPMIVVNTSAGEKQAFFFGLDELKQFAMKTFGGDIFDDGRLVLRVGDLNGVLNVIEKDDQDKFIFYPNDVYRRINPSVINSD